MTKREKIGVARPKGPPLRGFRLGAPEEPTPGAPVHPTLVGRTDAKSAYRHRLNRRSKKGHRCFGRTVYQRRCQVPRRRSFSTGSTDGASVHTIGAMTSAVRRRRFSTGSTDEASVHCIGSTGGLCVSRQEFNGYFGL